MDNTALVGIEVERGAEVIAALDKAGIGPKVALWAVLPEYEDWRLYIAGREMDAAGSKQDAYGLVFEALRAYGITIEKRPLIQIRPMTDPFVKALRSTFSKSANLDGMRLGGQTFGDRFLEDAYVYRIR